VRVVASGITTATTRTYTLPNVSGTLATLGNLAQTFTGAMTFSGTLTASSTVTFSGTSLTLGNSASATTINLGTGANASGVTKTLNLGTGGASGSTTNINIGSTGGGVTTVNSGLNVTGPINASSGLSGSLTGNADTATRLANDSGSAPSYSCRAWVNFNGTGTNATNMTIRAQGNVSSVLKNGTGDWTVNFTTALPDANYTVALTWHDTAGGSYVAKVHATNSTSASSTLMSASAVRVAWGGSNATADASFFGVAVFR